jgi:hypothetical protein
MLNRRVRSTFVGSIVPTFVGMCICVSCPGPPRSKASMASGVSNFGFGAVVNDLLIEEA